MAWLTSDLLADVRRSGMFPDSAPGGVSDADILAQADKELQSRLLPLVLAVREEFYVQQTLQPIVGGQQFYRIPGRSIGNKLRDVLLQMSNNTLTSLPRIAPEQVAELAYQPGQYPWGYYLESDSVMLMPSPQSTNGAQLLMKYLLRPGSLVTHNDNHTPHVVAVSTLNSTTTRITHTGSATFNTDAQLPLDIVSIKPPFRTVMISVTPTAYATGQIDVPTASLPSDFTTANFGGGAGFGAIISLAETTPVVQLPPELFNLLCQRTLCRLLQAVGDLESLQSAEAQAAAMERGALTLITNRTEGEPKKVMGRLLQYPRRRLGRFF
jgi:hypothetical protein